MSRNDRLKDRRGGKFAKSAGPLKDTAGTGSRGCRDARANKAAKKSLFEFEWRTAPSHGRASSSARRVTAQREESSHAGTSRPRPDIYYLAASSRLDCRDVRVTRQVLPTNEAARDGRSCRHIRATSSCERNARANSIPLNSGRLDELRVVGGSETQLGAPLVVSQEQCQRFQSIPGSLVTTGS